MISENVLNELKTKSPKQIGALLVNSVIIPESAEDVDIITDIIYRKDITQMKNGDLDEFEEMTLIKQMHMTKMCMRIPIGLPVDSQWEDPLWDKMMNE